MATAWTAGDVGGGTTLLTTDHLHETHINEIRNAVNTAENNISQKTVTTVGTSSGADYVCDGTADDVQIQAAIDAVNTAGGGKVFVRAGTYNLSAGLAIGSSKEVIFEGEGRKTVLNSQITSGAHVLSVKNGTNATDATILRDFRINGCGSEGYGIEWYKCRDTCAIQDVFVQGVGSAGVYSEYSYNSYFQGVYAYSCGSNGFTINDRNNNLKLYSCKATSNTGYGFNIVGTNTDVALIGCDLEGNTNSDLYATDARALALISCHTERTLNGNCIYLGTGCNRAHVLSSNISLDAGSTSPNGIYIEGAVKTSIANNSYTNLAGTPTFINITSTGTSTEIYDLITANMTDASSSTFMAYNSAGVWTIDQNRNVGALVVDSEATSGITIDIDSETVGYSVRETINGIIIADYAGHYIYSGAAQTTGVGLFRLNMDSSNSTIPVQTITNDGSGNGLLLDQNGNGNSLYIDKDVTVNNTRTWAAKIDSDNAGTGTALGCGIDMSSFSTDEPLAKVPTDDTSIAGTTNSTGRIAIDRNGTTVYIPYF